MSEMAACAGIGPAPKNTEARVLAFSGAGRDAAAQRLLHLVSRRLNVPVSLLLHHKRCERRIARARQLSMYLMHVIMQRDYADVGKVFGRDRTTVTYACALIEDLREDPEFDTLVSELETELEEAGDAKELERCA